METVDAWVDGQFRSPYYLGSGTIFAFGRRDADAPKLYSLPVSLVLAILFHFTHFFFSSARFLSSCLPLEADAWLKHESLVAHCDLSPSCTNIVSAN